MTTEQADRIRRTQMFTNDLAFAQLADEIAAHERAFAQLADEIAVRLNGTSDIEQAEERS